MKFSEKYSQLFAKYDATPTLNFSKVYSIHAHVVEYISNGKEHKKYEFGCKVSVTATSKKCYIPGMKAFLGNSYDGHTLEKSISQMERKSCFKANDITLTVDIVDITIQERHWYILQAEGLRN